MALLSGCGSAPSPHTPSAASASSAAGAGGPAFGLTEDSAALLWSPVAASAPSTSSPAARSADVRLELAREQLSALHPAYVRLLIDWAALQPDPRRPPALEAPVSGCARTIGPCWPYHGVRAQLAAIASQQRAGGSGASGYQVVIVIFGTPAWAAQPAPGCDRGAAGAFSRPPSAAGLAAYRALIHALVALGTREGVALDWWAPWNEPNDPTFLAPQRAYCSPDAPASSPSAYAELALAMAQQLRAEGGARHLLLGELNAYESGAADRTSVAQFVAALPTRALCLGDAWSLHVYAGAGPFTPQRDPLGALESALDARGGCARGARVWITEAGAGAPRPGAPRPPTPDEARPGCVTLARQLARWSRDPRLGAVFQYTFRDDPAFPVGLVDAQLSRDYPVYRLWLAWLRARAAGAAPQASAGACSG